MFRLANSVLLIVLLSISFVFAQEGGEGTPAWNVTLAPNTRAPSTITVRNRCKKKHGFEIRPENVPFLEIGETEIRVKGGKNYDVPVYFDTTMTMPGTHEGQVVVICKSCDSEPTCTQDREILTVVLTVPGNPIGAGQNGTIPVKSDASDPQDPCSKLIRRCDELLKIANAKKAVADGKQGAADTLRIKANQADQEAKNAEAAATQAEALAKFPPPSGRGSVDGGQEYTTADSAYLEQMNAQVVADYEAGKIPVEEHQRRLKENTIEKARLERIKNEARLKKEAKDARQKADKARGDANKSKATADAAQKEADTAKAEADKARRAYEDCIKKANDECEKLKQQMEAARVRAEQARIAAAAEQRRIEAAAAAAAEQKRKQEEAAQRAAQLEEQRKKAAEDQRQRRLEILRTLFKQMYELGFISGSEIDENKVVLGFFPKFLDNPVENTVEEGLIPEVALDVIKEVKLIRNPCGSNIVKREAWEKLETMINPRTGRQYTDSEAQSTLEEMCRLLGALGKKLDELNKYLDGR